MKQLKTMRTQTKTKYYKVIADCFNTRTFDIHAMRAKHHVGTVIFQAMIKCNCISLNKGQAKWIAGPLTESLINSIYHHYEELKRTHQAAELLRKSNINPKQIIAKQYTAPAPAPSQIEKAHVDTSIADNTIDVSYRYAFITGMLMGVLITSIIAYLW